MDNDTISTIILVCLCGWGFFRMVKHFDRIEHEGPRKKQEEEKIKIRRKL